MTEVTATQGGYSTGWASTTTAPSGDQMGKDTFLKLLVAQLKYQDPMKPTDSTEMMSQTAQYTQVEKLTDLLTTSQSQSAISLVGREIVWNNALGVEQSGVVTGVTISNGQAVLEVGDEEVALESVMKVRAVAADSSSETGT